MLTGHCATLAQSVERLTRNEQVDSSILSSGSTALDVRRFSEHLGFCICASVRIGFRRARMVIARVAELVDAHVSGACVERHAGSSPVLGTLLLKKGESSHAEIAQLVEHNLAKVRVASSSFVFRSSLKGCSNGGIGRHEGLKIPFWRQSAGSSPAGGMEKPR